MQVSPPILSFYETIVGSPRPTPNTNATTSSDGDSANLEFGKAYGTNFPWSWLPPDSGASYHPPTASVMTRTADRSVSVRLHALPLPADIARMLHENSAHLHALTTEAKKQSSNAGLDRSATAQLQQETLSFAINLREAFASAGGIWPRLFERVWDFGPHSAGPNLLVFGASHVGHDLTLEQPTLDANSLPHELLPVWNTILIDNQKESLEATSKEWAALSQTALSTLRGSIAQGFQLATAAGPLCGEPMWGVAFVIDEVTVSTTDMSQASAIPSGQLMSAVRDAFRIAFQAAPQRLVEAIYKYV